MKLIQKILADSAMGLLGPAMLVTISVTKGIILLMAFLVSSFGLPIAAGWQAGRVQWLGYAKQDKGFG